MTGTDHQPAFEHVPLLLLLGLRRSADVIRRVASQETTRTDPVDPTTLVDVLLGVLSLEQQLHSLVGELEFSSSGSVRQPPRDESLLR